MKKEEFLTKLKKEGKIMAVESSEEIKQSYIEKSESSLISAKILLENDRLEESVALAYYSMYHMLTALLFKTGIKCENHSASIILLKEIFGIDNSDISFAKRERVDKQYYVSFKVTKEDVIDSVKKAEQFNSKMLDFISRLNMEGIKKHQEKFKKLLENLK